MAGLKGDCLGLSETDFGTILKTDLKISKLKNMDYQGPVWPGDGQCLWSNSGWLKARFGTTLWLV